MRTLYGIIYLGIILALAVCARIARKSGKQYGKAASILLICLMFPLAGNGIIIVSSSRVFSMTGCFLYYLGLDLSIAALLHFSFEYCRMSWPGKTIRNLVYGVFLVDVVQLLLNPFFHHAFEIRPVLVDGYDYYQMIPHFGQSFHRVVDYAIMAGIAVIFIVRVIRTPRLQKERYSVILGTLIFVTAWETIYIFSGAPIDRSMIGFGVFGLLVFYFSLYYRPMRLLDRMLGSVVSENMHPMYFFDDRQACIWMNRSGREFLGLGEEEAARAGYALENMFGSRHPGEEEWTDQVEMKRDGEVRYLELSKVPQMDKTRQMNGFYIQIRDHTGEHKAVERKLYNARHDKLTGLYNRDYLFERTRELLSENPETPYLVLRIEICDLKLVNDLYGNSFGDQILKQTAEWIQGNTRENCVSGRLGGESFGLCIPEDLYNQARAERWVNTFQASAGEDGYHPMIHLGVYRVTDRSLESSVMYDRAQMAMDTIRNDFRLRTAWYDESIRDRVVRNRLYSEELEGALKDGQIRPWLQPIVDNGGKAIGAEVLVRWVHPTDGVRTPGMFIPIFEKNGMIADLDRFIWREACRILARWKAEGKDLFLSINISPRDFYALDVEKEIRSLVKEYGLAPEKLRLEITESLMMQDQDNRIAILRNLQKAGFLIEMDDFGSGYSSLNMLREMQVDILKIDMVFIRNSADNVRAQAIVRHVIALAHELKIVPLTEGVETENQFGTLREMGCDLYQGYYFSRPVPEEEFEGFMG